MTAGAVSGQHPARAAGGRQPLERCQLSRPRVPAGVPEGDEVAALMAPGQRVAREGHLAHHPDDTAPCVPRHRDAQHARYDLCRRAPAHQIRGEGGSRPVVLVHPDPRVEVSSPSLCVGHVDSMGEQQVGDAAKALDRPDQRGGEPGAVDQQASVGPYGQTRRGAQAVG